MASPANWKTEQAEEQLALATHQPPVPAAPTSLDKNGGGNGGGNVVASPQMVEESPFHPPTELDADTLLNFENG